VFAALAYQANRHGWAINLALQRRVAQVQAVPLLQRFGRVLFACHTLRDPGFWLLLAAAFFWLPGWLHRALPQLLPARSEDANSRGIPDRSTAFTLALVCQCACLVAACLLSPENVNRRMVLLLPPLVVLAPLAFLGRKRDARRGPMAWPFLLLAALLAYYVGLLAVWSAQCYYAYFWLCRNAVDRTVAGVETPFPMWAALLLAVVVYLAVVLRRRQLRLIVGALALLAYAGWSCFTVGWCTLKPSYTVVEASVPLRRFVRRGDCMRFWLREGNQGFALCLENDATPMFMLGRTSLKAQRTDTSLAFRAYSITLRRRTTWRWAQSPLEAPVPEFDIEEELPVLRLIPNPLGVHSHDVRVLILKRRQPTE